MAKDYKRKLAGTSALTPPPAAPEPMAINSNVEPSTKPDKPLTPDVLRELQRRIETGFTPTRVGSSKTTVPASLLGQCKIRDQLRAAYDLWYGRGFYDSMMQSAEFEAPLQCYD